MKKLYPIICILLTLLLATACNDITNIENLPESEVTTTPEVVTETVATTDAPEFESAVITVKETEETVKTEATTADKSTPTATTAQTTQATTEATTQSTTETTQTTTETTTQTTTQTTTETTTVVTTTTQATSAQIAATEGSSNGSLLTPTNYSPLNYDDQNAMWFSFLELNAHGKGATEAQFRAYIESSFKDCEEMGINTVYVHVRAFGDAYYPSDYFTWSDFNSGSGSNPGYDPLQLMLDIAHDYGLSFHAWINPMRTMTASKLEQMPDEYLIKQWYNNSSTNGKYIVKPSNSDYYWLNPAYPEVRELICDGIAEIMQNYDVDAIHIDDYFYPTTDASFDSAAFNVSGYSDLSTWRLSVIDEMVSDMYDTIKTINDEVLFGVSPQGNIENNYYYMYADVRKWCSTPGYLDYIVPQVYFGFSHSTQPFAEVVQDWDDMVTLGSVDMVIGIAGYKAEANTSDFNEPNILAKQTEFCYNIDSLDGVAFFRYDLMVGNVDDRMIGEINALEAVLNS